MDKSIIYYTCNSHSPKIDELARKYLSEIGLPIICVSLNLEVDFGDIRIVAKGERGSLMMHKQIMMGLQACKTKYAFLAENDVLYPKSHFEFTPKEDNKFYFNVNVWKERWPENYFVRTDNSQQLSGMCSYTELMRDYFEKRVKQIETEGFDRHYEPRGNRENFNSKEPLICIRHDKNFTKSKWSPDDYRNKEYAKGWTESTSIPGWNIDFTAL